MAEVLSILGPDPFGLGVGVGKALFFIVVAIVLLLVAWRLWRRHRR